MVDYILQQHRCIGKQAGILKTNFIAVINLNANIKEYFLVYQNYRLIFKIIF